ncbi:hypothetical protein Q4534_11030 [Cyclobacterium sp. 1_MG-2023]|uniref:hypothetical protein n=1 Tax=Cyclobacterium sp. 1_MG-2023 TaxID=3062681 RepID=UPI0026E24F3C|nr:hypothetical protein [Cyclobacterium sp. 1_MG-2023]MDO6437946.1 hypothetical protein [Cyclobacterium sp. 1_MG-2023]
MKFKSNFITKLTHWEYWPTWLVYSPVVFYYLLLSARARSFFFFTLTNPHMEMGGLYNCSKYRQLRKLPSDLIPKTVFLKPGTSMEMALKALSNIGIEFPLIAKPDRGERGTAVKVIRNRVGLKAYLDHSKADILLQEFIQTSFEAGVFYYKLPTEKAGNIPSIVLKEFLTVVGDGKTSLKELVDESPRGRLVSKNLFKGDGLNPEEVLPLGKERILEPIGNHNRGTKFIDGTKLSNPTLVRFFDKLSLQLDSFYYGRVDLKANSVEDFVQGRGIKVLEINGVNAEPAHIYDPDAKLWEGIKTLLKHWSLIYKISKENSSFLHSTTSLKEAWAHYVQRKKIKK